MLKIGVIGISGRMGHALWEQCLGHDGVKVVCGVCQPNTTLPVGCAVEVKPSVEELTVLPDVFIDFSRPQLSMQVLNFAKAHNIKVVLGTTGFSASEEDEIKKIAKSIAIVKAANFSVGVNVMLSLIQKAATVMADADLEIIEAHHRYKVDSPSGTALAMGEAAARGRNVNLKDVMVSGRDGITGERQYGTIGFSSIRAGDIVGEHEAWFCSDGERVKLGHTATSRATFARGAIRSCLWLSEVKPGLYGLDKVLGLDKL